MTKMRAKFVVTSIESFGPTSERVNFAAVSKSTPYPEDGSDEDNTFAKFSPAANCSITIQNPALIGSIKPGEKYYVDFTRAE